MSIISEIERIDNNVKSAFAAVKRLGGVTQESYTSDDLAMAIETIPKNDSSVTEWTGKKWVVIGDSLSDKINGSAHTTEFYWEYINERTGISVENLAYYGAGYVRDNNGHTFVTESDNIPADADIITIFGGGNDVYHAKPIGSYTDVNTTTICGALNTILNNIQEICPNAKVGVIMPTRWRSYGSGSFNAAQNMVSELAKACNARNIQYLDLLNDDLLRPNTEEGLSKYYTDTGGVHPNAEGHRLISYLIQYLLESVFNSETTGGGGIVDPPIEQPEWEDIVFTTTNRSFIRATSDGKINLYSTTNANYRTSFISSAIPVTEGEKYKITCSANWGSVNYLFAVVNPEDYMVMYRKADGNVEIPTAVSDHVITIPKSGVKLYLSNVVTDDTPEMVCKKYIGE